MYMKDYTYSFEIKDILTQFVAAFDDIVIKRYDKNRVAKEEISVRYVLAPKQRVMYDSVNKAKNLTIPVVAVNLTGISRDTTRVFNKLDSQYNKTGDYGKTTLLMPVPVNIEVNVSIIARYLQDMDQILSNFVPYNNPYIIISWKEPTKVNSQVVEIRSEVLWSGNISITEPTDIASSEKYRVSADTSFTIKGWLFRNTNEMSKQIYFIDNNFIATRGDILITDTNYQSLFEESDIVETVSLSAIPTLTNAFYNTSGGLVEINSDFTLNKTISSYNSYVLYGTNLSRTETILLSSSSNIPLTTKFPTISSKYTGQVSGFALSASLSTVLSARLITPDLCHLSAPSPAIP